MRRRKLFAAAATVATAAALDVGIAGTAQAAPGRASAGTGSTDAGSTGAGSADAGGTGAGSTDPVPVPISALFNNNGIGVAAGDANIDGSGYGFPAAGLPSGTVTVDGVPYDLPANTAAGQNDNVVALGQTLTLPAGRYLAAYLLATSTYGTSGGTATVHYADGSTSTAPVSVPDWYSSAGALAAPYRYSPTGTDQHPVGLNPIQVWLDPARTATGITLPTTSAPAPNTASLHVFAVSVQPVGTGFAVRIANAASTTKQLSPGGQRSGGQPSGGQHSGGQHSGGQHSGGQPSGGQHSGGQWAQVVEATVVNLGSEWFTPQRPLTVTVDASGVRTVLPARISRLAPGEEARVEVGITSPTLPAGQIVDGTVRATGAGVSATRNVSLSAGIARYQATDASLSRHRAPDWYSNAKFGIFIHWGIYSVPAWGPVGKEYAEWYWNQMNNPNDPTYAYHAQTYGTDFNYDDFIPGFTAAKFDPRAWVRLIQEAGANYFVLTSKHHEGFALFDTAYSDRNSVKMGPRQDLVKRLFDAARKYAPALHPGVYYSLPEWYNPADPWYGHAPQNPYTGQPVPYTGYRPVTDYVEDFQVRQLNELITKYRPDILWGDIGNPATDRSVLQNFFNQALDSGTQVTVNDRMGLPEFDFTTPEYASSFSLQTNKFEACRGIDPFSFGYNAATPDSAYATADELIRQLVDIVSKNGNLLLDIGPRADGTIADIMQTRLREIGAWLKVNGEAIYDTTYWAKGAAEGDLRFTVRPDEAFYIISLTPPASTLAVTMPVPIGPRDTVTMLGHHGAPLSWTKTSIGQLVIDVPDAARRSGQHAWAFKVTWRP